MAARHTSLVSHRFAYGHIVGDWTRISFAKQTFYVHMDCLSICWRLGQKLWPSYTTWWTWNNIVSGASVWLQQRHLSNGLETATDYTRSRLIMTLEFDATRQYARCNSLRVRTRVLISILHRITLYFTARLMWIGFVTVVYLFTLAFANVCGLLVSNGK